MTNFKVLASVALLALTPAVAMADGVEVLSTQAASAAGTNVAAPGVAGTGAGAGAGAGSAAAAGAAGAAAGTLTTVAVVGAVAVAGVVAAAAAGGNDDEPNVPGTTITTITR